MDAIDLDDVEDGVLPLLALRLAVGRLWVLSATNVAADVAALVLPVVPVVRAISAVGVVAGVAPFAMAAVHHCAQVRQSILDLIHGILQLLNSPLHSAPAVHTDLDGGATNSNAVVVVDHHGTAVDLLGREACFDAQVVHLRRHGALDHVANVHPGVFRIEVLVPEVATNSISIGAGHALVDVNSTAVGCSACGLIAPGVEALREQPTERLRLIIRFHLWVKNSNH